MTEQLRTVSIYETDHNFYVVADPAFKDVEAGYDILDFMAHSVYELQEGRMQVFVYPRNLFEEAKHGPEAGLREYIEGAAKDVGGFAVSHITEQLPVNTSDRRKVKPKRTA